MILSHAQIEDIAAATTKDFNKFFYRESEQQIKSKRQINHVCSESRKNDKLNSK